MSTHEPASVQRPATHGDVAAGYELRDAHVVPLALAALALFALLFASMMGMRAFFRSLDARAPDSIDAHSMVGERQIPPQPRLQVQPSAELEAFRTEEERTLATYGWIDREAGIVRIPIERAMELTVQRGLPQRAAAETHGEGE